MSSFFYGGIILESRALILCFYYSLGLDGFSCNIIFYEYFLMTSAYSTIKFAAILYISLVNLFSTFASTSAISLLDSFSLV